MLTANIVIYLTNKKLQVTTANALHVIHLELRSPVGGPCKGDNYCLDQLAHCQNGVCACSNDALPANSSVCGMYQLIAMYIGLVCTQLITMRVVCTN